MLCHKHYSLGFWAHMQIEQVHFPEKANFPVVRQPGNNPKTAKVKNTRSKHLKNVAENTGTNDDLTKGST